MEEREVVILSAVRTAVGKYGGTLKDQPPTALAAGVLREAVRRSGVSPENVGHVVFGNVIHTDSKDMYLSRVAALGGGLPSHTPALTLNRLCGSGLQAILSAADLIYHRQCDAAVAGGVESMSRAPYWLPAMRWGARLNDSTAVDALVASITDPFENVHMGITAENIAQRFHISREDQDALAVESHRRALAAQKENRFADQIVPVQVKVKGGSAEFSEDESPRADATVEGLAKLKPAFREGGTVTAGNASTLNDGAAAVVLMEGKAAGLLGLKPMARLVGYAMTGVEPGIMGMGPVSAVRKVMGTTGLNIDDMNVVELNEAFAAQALAVQRELKLCSCKTNPNGSGISLGHPIGATGAIITVKALYELQRTGGRYALVTMCIGGGQGIAAIFESLH
jgi:acetyl-CoA C-acetyltransferase